MTVYVVGLVVFLAIAAIFLEFTFWIEKEIRETKLWDDEAHDAYLSLVAPKPYDWKQK